MNTVLLLTLRNIILVKTQCVRQRQGFNFIMSSNSNERDYVDILHRWSFSIHISWELRMAGKEWSSSTQDLMWDAQVAFWPKLFWKQKWFPQQIWFQLRHATQSQSLKVWKTHNRNIMCWLYHSIIPSLTKRYLKTAEYIKALKQTSDKVDIKFHSCGCNCISSKGNSKQRTKGVCHGSVLDI